MSIESPWYRDHLRGKEILGILAVSTVVGGAMWWFGQSGSDITAAVASSFILGLGAQLTEPFRPRGTRQTGVSIMSFGIGSAIAYFGMYDTATSYLFGGFCAYIMFSHHQVFPR